jgi:hypothetical protein
MGPSTCVEHRHLIRTPFLTKKFDVCRIETWDRTDDKILKNCSVSPPIKARSGKKILAGNGPALKTYLYQEIGQRA